MTPRSEITGRFIPTNTTWDVERALIRFRSFCRFEPETGCVVWTGGTSAGRGHHVRYGVFWFAGRRWFAHRWAAKFIHGLEIEDHDVDHCCDTIPHPNTLCVQHLGAETPARNRELQTMRTMIHLQVGLVEYEDVYGPKPEADDCSIPFYSPPAWLGIKEATQHGNDDCPF